MGLKDEVNIDNIRNEIAQSASAHSEINIIVEGATDAKLFEDFTDEDKCSIYQVKSRTMVITLMQQLAEINKNGLTIGIVDDDQNRLTGGEVLPPNTLYTDTNDIETMIFWSAAFPKIARQLFAYEKTPDRAAIKSLHDLFRDRAVKVGELRVVNKRKGWGLSFKDSGGKRDLDFKKIFDWRSNMAYKGDDELITAVKGHSRRPQINNAEAIAGLNELRKERHKPMAIIVGHDLTKIIALAMKKMLYKEETDGFEREQVEMSFRLAYSIDIFRSTKLYRDMTEMMAHHGISFMR